MKDIRLLLPLIEVMKIVRLTYLPPDMPRLSSPKPRLRHSKRHCHLSLLEQSVLPSVLSLAVLLYHPLLTSSTVLLPGNWHRSTPTPEISFFRFPANGVSIAEPEATCPSSDSFVYIIVGF